MNRVEFIRQLRIALSGSVNYNIVEENVRYYEDYIDMEIRKGKSEGQVLAELGSPRLIAKTIIETNKTAETDNAAYDDNTAFTEEKNQSTRGRILKMPLWLIGVFVILIICLLFAAVTSLISVLLPILLPILVVILVARMVQSLWK